MLEIYYPIDREIEQLVLALRDRGVNTSPNPYICFIYDSNHRGQSAEYTRGDRGI